MSGEASNSRMWYSVVNGGDGSASVVFFATRAEAESHQEGHNQWEGWAEECTGQVPVYPDGEAWEDYDDE